MRTSDSTIEVDVLIVGAGPAGLYACYYAGMRQLSVAMLDSLPEVGGQLMALYPEKPIYDVAGLPAVSGAELVTALHKQSEAAAPTWILGERAMTLGREPGEPEDRLVVTTDCGNTIRAGGVVLAAGIGSFKPRRIAVADGFLGRGVHYQVSKVSEFVGLDVVVVGGGDSAVDWANMLAPVAESVTVVHRRRTLRAHQASVNELARNGVRVLLDAEVVAAHGTEQLEGVDVAIRHQETRTCRTQALVATLGQTADLGPLLQWGCELEARHLLVDQCMETSVRGVFAAGDVTTYPGKVRIMATGFAEAATAVNHLAARLRPGESVFPGHSTDVMAALSSPAAAEGLRR